ncbi:hypothetical protein ACEUDO_01235 [Aeromonas rivipollensis]|uniref:hypothetical protein n=1 Tax=Aeromonas rivipollensis TaxID=948519 RepID=UPI0038DA98A8
MNNILYKLILFFLVFFFVIPMSMHNIGTVLLSSPIIFLVFCLFLIKENPKILSRKIIFSLFSYLLLVIFVAAVLLIHATNSFELIAFVVYGLIIYINAIMLVTCYRCLYIDDYKYKLLRNVYLAGCINAVFTILVLLSPDVRDILYSIIDTSPQNEEHLASGIRSSGLFVFGGSLMSLFHCLIIYIGLVYIQHKKNHKNIKLSFIDLVLIFLNVIAVFLSGRMGVLILIIGFLAILFFPERFTRANRRLVLNAIFLLTATLTGLVIFFYNEFKVFIEWAFELFINVLSGNEATTASSEVLKSMYHFPNEIIFGEGVFSSRELGIDSGYVLLTWYFGVFAVLATLILLFYNFLLALQNNKNRDMLAVYITCLCLILIGNFKDVYLFGSNGITQVYFISMLLCFFSCEGKKQIDS